MRVWAVGWGVDDVAGARAHLTATEGMICLPGDRRAIPTTAPPRSDMYARGRRELMTDASCEPLSLKRAYASSYDLSSYQRTGEMSALDALVRRISCSTVHRALRIRPAGHVLGSLQPLSTAAMKAPPNRRIRAQRPRGSSGRGTCPCAERGSCAAFGWHGRGCYRL